MKSREIEYFGSHVNFNGLGQCGLKIVVDEHTHTKKLMYADATVKVGIVDGVLVVDADGPVLDISGKLSLAPDVNARDCFVAPMFGYWHANDTAMRTAVPDASVNQTTQFYESGVAKVTLVRHHIKEVMMLKDGGEPSVVLTIPPAYLLHETIIEVDGVQLKI